MGGPCDAPLSANSYSEMMKVGMDHVKKANPEMAADIEAMAKDDPKMVKWEKDFKKTWGTTPES